MREIRSYRTLKKVKTRWIRFEKYVTANKWDKNVWAAIILIRTPLFHLRRDRYDTKRCWILELGKKLPEKVWGQ